jgi:hypothetical protein
MIGSVFAIILQPWVNQYPEVTIPGTGDVFLLETTDTGSKAKISYEDLKADMNS